MKAITSMLRNPVLVLAWGLPLLAIIASTVTLVLAVEHGDRPLPEQYHSEGLQVDRDFARFQRAADLSVSARVEGVGSSGACTVELRSRGTPPESLRLSVTHAAQPALDRSVVFRRAANERAQQPGSATYVAQCTAAPAGHWRLELTDSMHTWSIRQSQRGPLDHLVLDAGNTRSAAQ